METISALFLLVKYFMLGIVQGITEPIPISSSGHLVILRELFGIEIKGLSFEIVVNFGSLIAVLLVYRKDITRLTSHFFQFIVKRDPNTKKDFQFILFLVAATIPTGVIGLLLEDYISEKLSGALVVGVTLLITGIAIWVIRNLSGSKSDGDLTIKDAIIVGLAQAVALIPGISRSGATIVAAMLVGMKKETALRFSFLLYIPVSLGVTVLSASEIIHDPDFDLLIIPYIIAFIAALVASYFALQWFMNIMLKGQLKYFSFYCFIVGGLVIYFMN
jgi:undecaprenyl-diphosphatase